MGISNGYEGVQPPGPAPPETIHALQCNSYAFREDFDGDKPEIGNKVGPPLVGHSSRTFSVAGFLVESQKSPIGGDAILNG